MDINPNRMSDLIKSKLRQLTKHGMMTNEIGRHGEFQIATILEDLDYREIETRKKKHNGIGLGRKDIDDWGRHPKGYFHCIESKNRRQPVNVNDVKKVDTVTKLAHYNWNLPTKPALVCTFLGKKAREKANLMRIPFVITQKQFVPEKYSEFYEKYRESIGSYYVEIVDYRKPPKRLVKKFKDYIFKYDYDPKLSTICDTQASLTDILVLK